MDKIPFHISASAENRTALIRITGSIGWVTDSETFRARIDAIAKEGLTDAHLYLNGPGGSVFDAEEIVNIIKSVFTGKVTGEGGALVASAYTRIAAICETFEMPENGSYMIHKPQGGACGTATQIRSSLKLLEDKEAQYLAIYQAQAKDKEELNKRWEAGDWWMTAKEAKAAGFITGVKGKAPMDASAVAMISACGCPKEKIPAINNTNNSNNMDLQTTAVALGLPKDASEAQVEAALAKATKAQAELDALKAENIRKEKEAREKEITAIIEAAIKEKRITAESKVRENWKRMLEADFEAAKASLEAILPVKKVEIIPGAKSNEGLHNGKTFAQLQDEDPEALAELEKNDPETFKALWDQHVKTLK